MELILDILYLYVAIYSFYFLALAIRNLNDKPFKIEKRYSQYADKNNLAVVVYARNNRITLENLIKELKMQDYPVDSFRVFVILDNSSDNSEQLFSSEPFINLINIKNVGTVGKDQAVSMLIERLSKDNTINSYVFIDADRSIPANFLTTINSALVNHSALSGETLILTDNLGPIDKIKAAYQKYHMNFMRKARSLFGLASSADSGVFVIKKEVVDNIGSVDFKDINSELKYSILLSKIQCPCTYNPNIQTYVDTANYEFRKPRLSVRLDLFKNCFSQIWTKNFVFAEHTFSLLNPNIWLILFVYAIIMKHSYRYYFFVDFRVVLLTFLILIAGFGISLINSKLRFKEIVLLCLYPVYSFCHIIKNLPPVRLVRSKITKIEELPEGTEKLEVEAFVMNSAGRELPCMLEFISESGLAKIKFLYKNKKFMTGRHLRMIDALQELRTKLYEYGFVLKLCSCCKYFTSDVDGSTNMLKGFCNSDYPSPSLKDKPTLIWNSCTDFEPAKVTNLLDDIADEQATQE
jgi:hypothetical protein